MDLLFDPLACADIKARPYRKDGDYSYTCGVYPTLELTDSNPSAVFRIIVSSHISRGYDLLEERARLLNIPLITDDKAIARLSPKENCFAIGLFVKYRMSIDASRSHIVLVNPSDMGNLGTIIRTLTAFGFKDLAIIKPCADIFDPRVVRASMGALFRIRFELFDSFDEYTKHCGERTYYPFMLSGKPLESVDFSDSSLPASLIFGNESSGLDEERFCNLGYPLRISHENTVDSLNLTIAAGIGMHRFCHHGGRL